MNQSTNGIARVTKRIGEARETTGTALPIVQELAQRTRKYVQYTVEEGQFQMIGTIFDLL
jgi:hypothetical protein